MFRPMKAATCEDAHLASLRFPLYASVKLDGIRCVITPEGPVTNTLKPIRNDFICDILSDKSLVGLDGELCLRDPCNPGRPGTALFSDVSSAIMSKKGEPDFIFWCFDAYCNAFLPFDVRKTHIPQKLKDCVSLRVRELPQTLCTTPQELTAFEEEALTAGYEGIMLRAPEGLYKYGRSTLKEQWLLKRKPFVDEEAEVIGLVEAFENTNEKTVDARGLSKRSQKQEGKVAKGTLGGIVLRSPKWGEFPVGTGTFTAQAALEIWLKPWTVLGKIATFKYQAYGSKDKPRIPVLKGFRDPSDLPEV